MPENRFDIDQHDPERSGSEKAEAERSRFGHEKVRISTSAVRDPTIMEDSAQINSQK